MRKIATCVCTLLCTFFSSEAQQRKIIDVHIHCYDDTRFASPAPDVAGCSSSRNAAAHFTATYAALRKAGVVKAVISGSPNARLSLGDPFLIEDVLVDTQNCGSISCIPARYGMNMRCG